MLNSRPHTEPPQAIATSLPPGSEVSDRNPYVVLQHLRVSVVAALKSSTAAAQAKDVSRARAVIDEALLFLTEATSGLEVRACDGGGAKDEGTPTNKTSHTICFARRSCPLPTVRS